MSIDVSGLTKSFGDLRVLRQVTFSMEGGGKYCLMGPSGAGKTTLLRCILGLEPIDAGEVSGLRQGQAAVVFQEDRLCNALTPVENVVLVLGKKASRRAARQLLGEILPASCMDRPAIELSGGQRRRVSLARAMAYPGKLVVMDEPFTGLDSATRQTVIDFILRHQDGRTLLISTHGDDDPRLLGAERLDLARLSAAWRA